MIRLLIATAFLATAVAPAFATCPRDGSVSRDTTRSTVASQPTDDHATPPPAAPAARKPS